MKSMIDEQFKIDFQLKNGESVLIRPLRAEDAESMQVGFKTLSQATIINRFLTPKKQLSENELAYYTHFDAHDHFALGAGIEGGSADKTKGIAIARWMRRDDAPQQADFALLIQDAYQGQGLGTCLMRLLIQGAQEQGLDSLHGTCLAYNLAMQGVLKRLGPVHFTPLGDGELDILLDLKDFETEPIIPAK